MMVCTNRKREPCNKVVQIRQKVTRKLTIASKLVWSNSIKCQGITILSELGRFDFFLSTHISAYLSASIFCAPGTVIIIVEKKELSHIPVYTHKSSMLCWYFYSTGLTCVPSRNLILTELCCATTGEKSSDLWTNRIKLKAHQHSP